NSRRAGARDARREAASRISESAPRAASGDSKWKANTRIAARTCSGTARRRSGKRLRPVVSNSWRSMVAAPGHSGPIRRQFRDALDEAFRGGDAGFGGDAMPKVRNPAAPPIEVLKDRTDFAINGVRAE